MEDFKSDQELTWDPDDITNDKNRQKTDSYWIWPLIVTFILYWIVAGLAIAGFKPTTPIETTKNVTCGLDSNVLDKPYQLFLDARDCYVRSKEGPSDPIRDFNDFCFGDSICVKECPTTSFNLDTCIDSNIDQFKSKIICDNSALSSSARSCYDLKVLVKGGRCTNWYNNSTLDGKQCKPILEDSIREYVAKQYSNTNSTQIYQIDFGSTDFKHMIFPILAALFVTLALSLVLIRTMRWVAAYVFWGFIVFIFLLFVAGIVALIITASRAEYPADREESMKVAYIVSGVMALTLFIIAIAVFFMRHKIRTGIELVKEGSRAVCCSTASVFMPIIPFLIRAFFVLLTAFFFFAVFTDTMYIYKVTGMNSTRSTEICQCPYQDGDECLPEKFNQECRANGTICYEARCSVAERRIPPKGYVYLAILGFAAMWTVAFVCAVTKMILAHAFGQWYWKFNKEMIPSGTLGEGVTRIFNYHLGTAALGALVITICRVLRWLLNWDSKKRSEGQLGVVEVIVKVLVECLKCILDALLRLIQYISDKAFVICSIHGTAYWDSVKRVSKLFVKDILLVVAVENVSDIVLGVCKFLVAILSTGTLYAFWPKNPEGADFSLILGCILTFIFAYDLCSILFTSYHVAIDTILVCTLEDWHYTNKAQKRYFHSEVLNKLLNEQPATPAAAV